MLIQWYKLKEPKLTNLHKTDIIQYTYSLLKFKKGVKVHIFGFCGSNE